jgi:Arc/MetJ-type ribon-helix-helix transcriptional regulator
MATHSKGKGMVPISTSLPKEAYSELLRRKEDGHWKSVGAYIRAVLELHVQQQGAVREKRMLVMDTPPVQDEEKGDQTTWQQRTHK